MAAGKLEGDSGHHWLFMLGFHLNDEQAREVSPMGGGNVDVLARDDVDPCLGHSGLGCGRCGRAYANVHDQPCEPETDAKTIHGQPSAGLPDLLRAIVEGDPRFKTGQVIEPGHPLYDAITAALGLAERPLEDDPEGFDPEGLPYLGGRPGGLH